MTIPFRLKQADSLDDENQGIESADDQGQPVNEDSISALTEAQILEMIGRLGSIKAGLLAAFGQAMSPAARRPLRIAYGATDDAIRLGQAVVGSTARRR
jgi:hypothetical protein